MFRFIVVLLLAIASTPLFAAIPSPEDPAAVAAWFAEVLRGGDVRQFQQELEPGAQSRAWKEIPNLLGKYDCISAEPVESATTWLSPDLAVIRTRLRAAGHTRADWHPRFELPDRWQLELHRKDGAWRVRSAITEERIAALCMIAEPSLDDADRIFTEAAGDPLLVISSYAAEGIEPENSRRRDTLVPHALVLARESGSASVEVEVLQLYGVHLAYGKKPGLPLVQEAVEIARARGDHNDLALAIFRVGSVYIAQQQFDEALPHLREAASMVHEASDPVTPLKALRMYAWVAEQQGKYYEDVRALDRLRELSRHYGWREGETVAAQSTAYVLYMLGHEEPSMAAWYEAARLSRAIGNPEMIAMAHHNIAIIHFREQQYKRAAATAREAAALVPPDSRARPHIYNNLIAYLALSGDIPAAEQALQEAKRGRRMSGLAETDQPGLFIAESLVLRRAGKHEEALAAAQAAVDILEPKGAADFRTRIAFTHKGRALRALGRREEALEALRTAIDVIEVERRLASAVNEARISVFERRMEPYTQAVEILAEREETAGDALRMAEQMKARALLEATARRGDDLSAELTAEEREREKAAELRVAEANRALRGSESREDSLAALNAARMELSGFRGDMRLKYPRLAQRDFVAPADLRMPDVDAVEFVVGEQQVTAFLVPSAASGRPVRTIVIPVERAALVERITRYFRALSSRSFGYRTEARALYDLLLAPLGTFVNANAPLYIIPDGPLWSVPFQTLLTPDGAHLAEVRAIAYAPSLAILHAERPRHAAGAGLLAFANPSVDGAARDAVRAAAPSIPLGALPEAEEEVETISALYGNRLVRVRERATESAFKREAEKYRVLHLATHGFIASGAPMYSGLVFRDDAQNDGILEAREVADMKLGADLAVLSACDTAAARISDGEGAVGLSWAFHAAGCPTTVVSQWKADSAATAKLMIEFHRQLARNYTPAEALRRAQRSMIASVAYRHPYYWAPFIVLGKNTMVATQ